MPIIESGCVAAEREAWLHREDFRIMRMPEIPVINYHRVATESDKSRMDSLEGL